MRCSHALHVSQNIESWPTHLLEGSTTASSQIGQMTQDFEAFFVVNIADCFLNLEAMLGELAGHSRYTSDEGESGEMVSLYPDLSEPWYSREERRNDNFRSAVKTFVLGLIQSHGH